MNSNNNWPEYLRKYRSESGYSQRKLAQELRISYRNIENWEQGKTIPPGYLIFALKYLEGGWK